MGKYAYLIICHRSDASLCYLLKSIDDDRNDIYVHVDAKARDFDFDKVKASVIHSELSFTRRINVTWGGYSQPEAEMILLEAATQKHEYAFYHFLSGNDMCIKSQDAIHQFFDQHSGKLFLTFCGEDWNQKAEERVKYYHIEHGRSAALKALNIVSLSIQKMIGIDRLKHVGMHIVGGSNWCSLPHDFVMYLLAHKEDIYRIFHHSVCSDELFIHMMAYNSEYKDRIYLLKISRRNDDSDPDMFTANQRYIDWNRGKPYIFGDCDFDELMKVEYCFARKLTETDTNHLMKRILEYKGQKTNVGAQNETQRCGDSVEATVRY